MPVDAARFAAERVPVCPPAGRSRSRRTACGEAVASRTLGIADRAVRAGRDAATLARRGRAIGEAAVLKTRRLGYDGKGQAVLARRGARSTDAWSALAGAADPGGVRARSTASSRSWAPRPRRPVASIRSREHHRDGILRLSLPRAGADGRCRGGRDARTPCLDQLGVRRRAGDRALRAPRPACCERDGPRVHNTGHWTIEGAETSQFENHLRAILGLPLGDTTSSGHAPW